MARRTAAEAAQTRRDILSSARHLFATVGYSNVSVPDIAAAVGVTHGALYHHFATKEDLFREVFREVEQELDDAVVRAATSEPTMWDAFVAGTRCVLTRMADPGYLQIALTDAPGVFGWHEWHTIDSAVGMRTLRTGLSMLRSEGYLEGVDLDALAIILFGGMTEAGITLARASSPVDVDEVVETTCQIVLALSPGVDRPAR